MFTIRWLNQVPCAVRDTTAMVCVLLMKACSKGVYPFEPTAEEVQLQVVSVRDGYVQNIALEVRRKLKAHIRKRLRLLTS